MQLKNYSLAQKDKANGHHKQIRQEGTGQAHCIIGPWQQDNQLRSWETTIMGINARGIKYEHWN